MPNWGREMGTEKLLILKTLAPHLGLQEPKQEENLASAFILCLSPLLWQKAQR